MTAADLKKIIFFYLLFFSMSSLSYAAINDYVAYWSLNMTSADLTGNHDLNIYSGGGALNITAYKGYGIHYDGGNDYSQEADHADFDFTNAGCVNFWLRVNQTVDADKIISKDKTSGGWAIQMRSSAAVNECHSGYCLCFIKGGIERECQNRSDSTGWLNTTSPWQMFTVSTNGSAVSFWRNGADYDNWQFSNTANMADNTNELNFAFNGDTQYANIELDEVSIFKHACTPQDVADLWSLYYVEEAPPVVPSDPLVITAVETISGNTINNFNATIDGNTFGTTNGTISSTGIFHNASTFYNITLFASGYLDKFYLDVNVSLDLAANLTKIELYNLSYSNYNTTNAVKYVRNLTYSFNYTCESGSTGFLDRYINASLNNSAALTCDNTTNEGSGSFQNSAEGAINIYFAFNVSVGNSTATDLQTFIFDLNNPTVVNVSFDYAKDFVEPSANITMNCTDNIFPNLRYNMTFNDVLIYYGNHSRLIQQKNATTNLVDGDNTVAAVCSDPFGSTSDSVTQNIELRNLYMIDEQKNLPFDVQNLSSVIVYIDDNRTSYNFKLNSKNNISFVADYNVKLRFELIYNDGTIILRYVDIGLLQENIRVCANTEGITHYEQILTSSTSRPVILKSVFADCVVAADYTRFAYQNTKILKAYTYNNLYYLYTFENNDITADQVFLASVDGSIATYINLDSLEFIEEGYNINTVGDTLAVKKYNANEMEVYYYNVLQNNAALRIVIERLDTDEVLLNTTSFVDENEAQIFFNFATLSPAVNDTSLFRVTSTATNTEGDSTTTIKYFNTQGVTGSLSSGMVAIVSILVLIFGLSFTIAQRTFAYFGIFVVIANIAFLSFATGVWYITFLIAVNAIILIYIWLVLSAKNTVQIG